MKIKFFTVLFIFSSFILYGQNIYRDNNLHYSFTIPKNWEIIPRQAIDNYLLYLQRSTGQKSYPVDNGIQIIKSPNNISYMFMQHHNESMTWNEFIESAGSVKLIDEIKNDLAQEYDLVRLLNSKSYFIDINRRMIVHSFESNIFGLEQQITLMILFLGNYNIVQFNLNYYRSRANEYFNYVYTIINSFKFDDGYAYR